MRCICSCLLFVLTIGLVGCFPSYQKDTLTTISSKMTPEEDTIKVVPPKRYGELGQHLFPFGKDSIVANFPAIDVAYAVVYELDPNRRYGATSVFKGRTGSSKSLSLQEVERFNTIIRAHDTYGDSPAACFDPRVGLVYYNADSLPIAHISICFDCAQSYPYPKIQGQEEQEDHLRGLSETGSVRLKYLLAEWGFPHTRFNPMMNGAPTLHYLEEILPQVLDAEEAQLKLEQYKTLFEESQPD